MAETVNVNCWGVAIQLIQLMDGTWTWALAAENESLSADRETGFAAMSDAFIAARVQAYLRMRVDL